MTAILRLRAWAYDVCEGSDLRRGGRKAELFSRMTGRTLFMAAGTGIDFKHFPPQGDITAIDISADMLARAARRRQQCPGALRLVRADALNLPFAGAAFDTAATSCTLCSVPDPERVRRAPPACFAVPVAVSGTRYDTSMPSARTKPEAIPPTAGDVAATVRVGRWPRRHPIVSALLVVAAGFAVYDRVREVEHGGNDAVDFVARTGCAGASGAGGIGSGVDADGTTQDRATYHARWFDVARVVDGDTLEVAAPDGPRPVTRIRLWGVDAPESTGDEPTHYGAEAAAFARERLAGKAVYVLLSPRQTRDRYGRLLAYVHLDRNAPSFNEALIETGHAYADPRFEHHYTERFAAMETHARKQGVGLWGGVTEEAMPAWRRR